MKRYLVTGGILTGVCAYAAYADVIPLGSFTLPVMSGGCQKIVPVVTTVDGGSQVQLQCQDEQPYVNLGSPFIIPHGTNNVCPNFAITSVACTDCCDTGKSGYQTTITNCDGTTTDYCTYDGSDGANSCYNVTTAYTNPVRGSGETYYNTRGKRTITYTATGKCANTSTHSDIVWDDCNLAEFSTANTAGKHSSLYQCTNAETGDSYTWRSGSAFNICDIAQSKSVKSTAKSFVAKTSTTRGAVTISQTLCDTSVQTNTVLDKCTPVADENNTCTATQQYMECESQETGTTYNICETVSGKTLASRMNDLDVAMIQTQETAEEAAEEATTAKEVANAALPAANFGTYFTSALAAEANKTAVKNAVTGSGVLSDYATTEQLATKANTSALNDYVKNTEFADKFDTNLTSAMAANGTIGTALAAKANASELSGYATTEQLATKANTSALNDYVKNTEFAGKFDTNLTSAMAANGTIGTALAAKANAGALNNYVLKDDFDDEFDTNLTNAMKSTGTIGTALAAKADASELSGYATTEQLATKANTSALNDYVKNTEFAGKFDTNLTSAMAANGTIGTALAAKANASELSGYATTEQLATKANTSALNDYVKNTEFAGKFDTNLTSAMAATGTIGTALAAKANASTLNDYVANDAFAGKFDTNLTSAMAANGTIGTALAAKANASALNDYVANDAFAGKFDTNLNSALEATGTIGKVLSEKADASALNDYVANNAFAGKFNTNLTSAMAANGTIGTALAVKADTSSVVLNSGNSSTSFNSMLAASNIITNLQSRLESLENQVTALEEKSTEK